MIDTAPILIIYIAAVLVGWLYACIEGAREGHYFNEAVETGAVEKINLHPLFFTQRLIVMLSISMFIGITSQSLILTSSFIISSLLCFSFFHNGVYFVTRNNLNYWVYPKRFKASKSDRKANVKSKAVMEFSYKNRLVQFILGVLLSYASIFIYLYNK